MLEQTLADAERALAQGERADGARLLAHALETDQRPENRARVLHIAERHLIELREPAPAHGFAALPADPLVSVVVPTRNRPALLGDALASIVAQAYSRWEIVLVNDGGEPVENIASAALGDRTAGGRLRAFSHAQSEGPAYARNTGIAEARGEVIAFLDDDDRLAPAHLRGLVSALADTRSDIAYSGCDVVVERLEGGARIELSRHRQPMPAAFNASLLLVRNYIPLNCCAFRAELFRAHGGFDELLSCLEDWELLLRLGRKAGFVHVDAATAEYRVRAPEVCDSVSKARPGDTASAFARIYGRHTSADPLVAVAREAYRWLVLSGNYAKLG